MFVKVTKEPGLVFESKKLSIFLLLLSGLPLFFFGKYFINETLLLWHAQNWLPVEATVLDAQAAHSEKTGSSIESRRGISRRVDVYEHVGDELSYTYTFQGVEYVSHRYGPCERWNFGSNLRTIAAGQNIRIYVNPIAAWQAIIDRTMREGYTLCLVVFLCLLIWFVWASLAVFYQKRFVNAFASHAFILIALGIMAGTLVASVERRTLDWWLIIGGFLGCLATIGVAGIASVWSKKRWNYVAGFGLIFGFLITIFGALLRGYRARR